MRGNERNHAASHGGVEGDTLGDAVALGDTLCVAVAVADGDGELLIDTLPLTEPVALIETVTEGVALAVAALDCDALALALADAEPLPVTETGMHVPAVPAQNVLPMAVDTKPAEHVQGTACAPPPLAQLKPAGQGAQLPELLLQPTDAICPMVLDT